LSRLVGIVVVLVALSRVAAVTQSGPVGEFEAHGDIGSPKITGAAAYDEALQQYALSAGGVNMWAQKDEFHFAWKRMTGDFIIQARVELLGQGVDPHRKVGLMVRPTQDADAPYVDGMVHGDGLTSLQFRRTKGAITEQKESTVKGADVIQVERRGQTYIFSAAKFGDPFTVSEVSDVNLGDEVLVGLALCSHNGDVTERALFKDVRVVRPAKPDFVPYRDYIGSVLEILDLQSGRKQVIHRSENPFEAPNWTRDGKSLIFNTSGRVPEWRGRLHRFDLATRQSTPIDTGTNIRNNNDHVLSFDGKMLGISDQSIQGTGSTIYTVPVGGGTPKRITQLAPSYLHSWSPDGKQLIYTGGRNGEFEIYSIASDGSGSEVNLTNSKGLDDGPEYTPDGKYIYFNSVRSGLMQIWRMQPDGKNQEQITNDEFNNWFPHISPDGQSIVIISFPKDIDPTDHPYYKRVYLRLMPIAGGTPKVVAYVYGGQGTINVPSWSPDSKKVAFVSNTDTVK
jgi:Tol biopolymer transport system component